MLKIGNLELESNVILAPMAGVTNSAFKAIIRNYGSELICTEMVNDRAIINGNKHTYEMMQITKEEHPVAIQLFGSTPETMSEAAKIIEQEIKPDILDINMGCPAPKILKSNSGSKILLDPNLVEEILSEVVNSVNLDVTVKMRIGWDEDNINIIENAKRAEKAGVKAIFIHGRTTKQHYSGLANWDIIGQVKKKVNIPVIGNGDITNPIQAKQLIDKYNLDGVMVGRAVMGNPWLLNEITTYIKSGELKEVPTIHEKIEVAKKHYINLIKLRGEKVATNEMRGHASWYIKGISGANEYRRLIQIAKNEEEMIEILNKIQKGEK